MKLLNKCLQYIADKIIDRLSKANDEEEFAVLYRLGMEFNNFCVYVLWINLE